MNPNTITTLDDVRAMTHNRLANDAGLGVAPDAKDSSGATFLSHVRDAVVEALEWKVENEDPDLAHAARVLRDDSHELADAAVPVYTYDRWLTFTDLAHAARVLRDDSHELADAAVPVYTYDRWLTFVDLAAWQVDIDEYVGGGEDMTTLAGVALYEVARTLVDELCDHVETMWAELEADEDDEQDEDTDEELDSDPGE